MGTRWTWAVLGALILAAWPQPAAAHQEGYHQHVRVVLAAEVLEVLVVMDVDGGRRARLLRAAADTDRDGALGPQEHERLRAKLAAQATAKLEVSLSGYSPRLQPVEAKLGLRGDEQVSDTGLSVAVLLQARLPKPPQEGMELVVRAVSPDGSHVKVEVEQQVEGGASRYAAGELRPGERLSLRLAGHGSL